MQSAKEIIPQLAPWVGESGTCEGNEERLLEAINEARQLLWNKMDYSDIMEWVRICCAKGSFILPARYQVMRQVMICGQGVDIKNQWYQTAVSNSCPSRDLGLGYVEDRGGYHSKYRDFPDPYVIEIRGESGEDEGKGLQFLQQDEQGRWVREEIKIGKPFEPSLGQNIIKDFTHVTKPETSGVVRVYGRNPKTQEFLLLAIYEPWQTNPQYKKYTIPNYKSASVLVYAKVKYTPIKTVNDLVEFPLQSMIHAVSAVSYRKGRDRENYLAELALAANELQLEMQSGDTQGSNPMKTAGMAGPDSLIDDYW